MKNDINDIKEILQEEQTQTKSDKELYNNLVRHLYNIFDLDIKVNRPDLLERGFAYFSYNDIRKKECNKLANNQKEYNFYFMNYDKALKQVKNFFKEDIKRINTEKEELQPIKQKKQKRKHTIFGVNWLFAIIMIPVVLFFQVIERQK